MTPSATRYAAAKARTIATPLATATFKGRRLTVSIPPREAEGLFRVGYVAVIVDADGAERLDLMRTLTNARETTQAVVDYRHRVDAAAIRKGTVPAYARVVKVEIREVAE